MVEFILWPMELAVAERDAKDIRISSQKWKIFVRVGVELVGDNKRC